MARGVLAAVVFAALAGCGDDVETDLPRLPQGPDVPEVVVPGAIFTRGPGGEVRPGAKYNNKAEVNLYGFALAPGDYYFEITTLDCGLVLAAPSPDDPNVPDTSTKVISVGSDGTFGPVALAPFNTTSDETNVYEVNLTPVDKLEDKKIGCFVFRFEETLKAAFFVDPEVAEPVTTATKP